MGRIRNYRNRYRNADPVMRIIIIAGVVLLIIIGLPRVLPTSQGGSDCLTLLHPSANFANQSILAAQYATLAAAQPDKAPLKLELVPASTNLASGESLLLYVRFINDSPAPLTLYLVPQSAIFRYNNEEIGLLVFLQNAADNRAIGERSAALTPPQQYTVNQLVLLGARQRCSYAVEINANRLQAAGITPGQYRVVTLYRNTTRGQLSQTGTGFTDQGVWTGVVQSNDVLVTIGTQ